MRCARICGRGRELDVSREALDDVQRESERRTHRLLVRVVGVGLAALDHLDAVLLQLVKVVARVARRVGLDAEEGEVLDDALLKLGLLLARVRVVEPDEELAVVHARKVLVEDGRLCVADVEVAARLGREARHDVALDGVGQAELERRVGLAGGGVVVGGGALCGLGGGGGLDLGLGGDVDEGLGDGRELGDVVVPAQGVRGLGEEGLGDRVGLEGAEEGVVGDGRAVGGGVGAEGEALLERGEEGGRGREGGREGGREEEELEDVGRLGAVRAEGAVVAGVSVCEGLEDVGGAVDGGAVDVELAVCAVGVGGERVDPLELEGGGRERVGEGDDGDGLRRALGLDAEDRDRGPAVERSEW